MQKFSDDIWHIGIDNETLTPGAASSTNTIQK